MWRTLGRAVRLPLDRAALRPCSSQAITIQDVRHHLQDILGVGRVYQPLLADRSHLLQLLPKERCELPPRTMKVSAFPQDSFTTAVVPLSTNHVLQEKYVMFLGNVRLGRLMEDVDIFCGYIASKHIVNPRQQATDTTPYMLVTALVDQIDFTDVVPRYDADIRLSGHVSWVGVSSMEVTVWLDQMQHGDWRRLTRAVFLLAARNTTGSAPAPINRLVAETDQEEDVLKGGEARQTRRRRNQEESLLKRVPNTSEQHVVHDLFVQTVDLQNPTFHKRRLPSGSVWMADATLSNIVFSHPEDRNVHNKVFGGFLIRNALEMSWTTAYLHSKFLPKLRHISDISFKKPVDVGSLIKMDSHITYTERHYMQILVHAEVLDPHGHQASTNDFHFTYELPQDVLRVIPQSYHEAMMYLDGRRHFQHVMGLDHGRAAVL